MQLLPATTIVVNSIAGCCSGLATSDSGKQKCNTPVETSALVFIKISLNSHR